MDEIARKEFQEYQRSKGYVHGETHFDAEVGFYEYPGMQEKWDAWKASWEAAISEAARTMKEVAVEVGGEFADTHRLNSGLNLAIKRVVALRGGEGEG